MTDPELAAVRERLAQRVTWLPRYFGGYTDDRDQQWCARTVNQAEEDRAALLQHIDSGWTPVSAGLPGAGVDVLITVGPTEHGPLAVWGVASYDGYSRWWGFRGHHLGKTAEVPVIAWRPLPEPYRVGGEG